MKLITVFAPDYFTHVSLGPRLLNGGDKLGLHWKSKGNSCGDFECQLKQGLCGSRNIGRERLMT
jgi:hypothetical protein